MYAKKGATGRFSRPYSLDFAGHHSRWFIRVAGDSKQALEGMEELSAKRQSLDVVDRLEVVLAYAAVLGDTHPRRAATAWADARKILAQLPAAVGSFLDHFGLMPPSPEPPSRRSRRRRHEH
jgi:hypothetical protein